MPMPINTRASSKDNWEHRSKGMTCATCMWFVIKQPSDTTRQTEEEVMDSILHLGRCRRHAPTMNGWPVMFMNDWCGDHKIDENKFKQES